MNPVSKDIAELPVFFIVGRGRSGSTLLRTIFDAHPGVCIPLESRFVQFLYYHYNTLPEWNLHLVDEAIDLLAKGYEPLQIDKGKALSFIKGYSGKLTLDIVCKSIYLSTHSEYEKTETKLIGDKNPRYSFFIPQLVHVFPEARFIHIIRDYRDHLVSVKRSYKKIRETCFTPVVISRWLYYNKQIQKQKSRYPERFYTLRFEDLITEPERQMKDLCAFLGLDFNLIMLDYTRNLEGYYNDEGFRYLHGSLNNPFDISKIGESQQKLSATQLFIAEVLAGDYGQQYGYKCHYSRKNGLFLIVKLFLIPVIYIGSLRYRLKKMLYPFPRLMKPVYKLILKLSQYEK